MEEQRMTDPADKDALAFEYVLGTMEPQEREAFELQLRTDDELAAAVRQWEQSMMPALDAVPPLAPKADTFSKIQASIEQRGRRQPELEPAQSFWQRLFAWKWSTAMAFSVVMLVSGFIMNNAIQQNILSSAPNADYVAVLVGEDDKPVLTALTSSDGKKLWLKWENWQAPEGHSLQLWSQSRRDGEVRPLIVFEGDEQQVVALDQATLRLIKDSSHLIITQEDIGGSPVDEPSATVVAKGVCIRLEKAAGSA